MTKAEILKELREQDEQLRAIFARREELAQMCKDKSNQYYNEMWEALFKDGKSHHSF